MAQLLYSKGTIVKLTRKRGQANQGLTRTRNRKPGKPKDDRHGKR